MKKEYKESFISKILNAIIFTPLLVSLVLSIWMWGVFSVKYLKNEIMQHQFSAFLYKEIYSAFSPYIDSTFIDPTFMAITLTLTVVIGIIAIALAMVTLFFKSIYQLFLVFNKKQSEENPEEENK